MKFIRIAFTKLRDYFTANNGRKIFFYGLVATTLSLIFYLTLHLHAFYIIMVFSLLLLGVGTLWDSMSSRYFFLKKIREIQYQHLKDINDKQESGENVIFTPTFTDDEKRYFRRRKWGFVLIILFKVGFLIALFSLLLNVQLS